MSEKLVKVIRNGNITIPKSERQKYNIRDGDYLEIIDEEDGFKFKVHRIGKPES